ncbi:hypothetical protein BCD67_10880 [Oscillatoriales cyanobacterium USR001]|nr:hypothetical protein BCD67_10880 [Oscillatoriales cyanobacterium USR001]
MNQLKNSSLSLFAFQLRHSIDNNPKEEVEENADKIWQKLAELSQPLEIPDLATLAQKLICYKDGKYTPNAENNLGEDEFLKLLKPEENEGFGKVERGDGLTLESLISPFRIHDTYAVELNLTCSNAIATSQLKELFNPENCLLPSKVEASIGQTLLLLTEPVETIIDEKKLAEDCVKNLLPDSNLRLRYQGQLFGSPIFEYDNDELDPIKSCHILIWLNTAVETLDLAINNSGSLLLLLCLYHKIVHSYYQSRQCNQKARTLYSQQEAHGKTITKFADRPQEAMSEFENLLPKLPVQGFDYAKNTRNLEDYLTTIKINTKNYQNVVAKIPEDERDFFRQMSSRANKYEGQIKADLRYLEPGQKLFDRAIDSIRGIVEIEQVKSDRRWQELEKDRDRNLQTIVAEVGVGIGAAGIAATASPYILQPNPKDNSYYLGISLLFSLVAGLIGVAIAARVMRHLQNQDKPETIHPIIKFILGITNIKG